MYLLKIWVLFRRQLNLFQFLEDISPLIQEASSVLSSTENSKKKNPYFYCFFLGICYHFRKKTVVELGRKCDTQGHIDKSPIDLNKKKGVET